MNISQSQKILCFPKNQDEIAFVNEKSSIKGNITDIVSPMLLNDGVSNSKPIFPILSLFFVSRLDFNLKSKSIGVILGLNRS